MSRILWNSGRGDKWTFLWCIKYITEVVIFQSGLHGSAPTGLSGRSFMRRVMDGLRRKVVFCNEYATGVYWKMPVNYCCHTSLRPTKWRRKFFRNPPSGRPCRLDLATVRQGSIASGGCSASQGRVLRRVRGRSVLCTPMRDNLSSYVCKKIVKKSW